MVLVILTTLTVVWVGLALLIGLGVMRGASKAERKIEELNEDDEV